MNSISLKKKMSNKRLFPSNNSNLDMNTLLTMDSINNMKYDNHSMYNDDLKKLSHEDRLHRCRERNRIHARNSRERKKSQLINIQKRYEDLYNEVCY